MLRLLRLPPLEKDLEKGRVGVGISAFAGALLIIMRTRAGHLGDAILDPVLVATSRLLRPQPRPSPLQGGLQGEEVHARTRSFEGDRSPLRRFLA
jgi:hypothetical protein